MQYRLVRDKEEGQPTEGQDYRYLLIVTAIDRLDELAEIDMKKKANKERAYTILADLIEIMPCLQNTFLQTKREVSTLARHSAAQKVAAQRANDLGSYFEGKIQEIHYEPSSVQ